MVEIESNRYSFCFPSNEKESIEARSFLTYLPFNRELNRLTVKFLSIALADGIFGTVTKTFSCEQLSGGINLAAEFITNCRQLWGHWQRTR